MTGLNSAELAKLLDCVDGIVPFLELGVIEGYLKDNSSVIITPLHAKLMVDHYANLQDGELSGVGNLAQLFVHLVSRNCKLRAVST